MGISVVYCFHQNNHVARRLFFAKKFPACLRVPLTAAGCHRADSRSLASSMRCLSARVYMPITPYVDDFDADLETKRVLGDALERTRVSLGLADKFADGIIARRIVELAKAGERNPDLLCQGAIEKLREHLYGD